jgi:transposase
MAGKQKYTSEFRESAVRLVIDQGRRPEEAAANLGMPVNTLMAWVSRARKNVSGGGGGGEGFTPPTEQQMAARVRALEAENTRLRLERDILKKATAFFAREDGGRP